MDESIYDTFIAWVVSRVKALKSGHPLDPATMFHPKINSSIGSTRPLLLDVVKGRGARFSLEIPLGLRIVIKSRLIITEEYRSSEEKLNL